MFISRTIDRFIETGSTNDRPRSGRPRSATGSEIQKKVAARIRRNPERSMRKMAADIKISERSMRRLVKRDLGLESLKTRVIHSLSAQQKKKRLERCKRLKAWYALCGALSVLFSDEKFFTVEAVLNRQNHRIITPSVSATPMHLWNVERVQKSSSVMVWAGVSADYRTDLVFVPSGVKINKEEYQNRILESVLKPFGHSKFKNQHWTFQQDGAPAHTAKTVQEWCKREIPDFISKDDWPPCSPDLNPMDFSVWSILEDKACAKPHRSVASLKTSLQKAWRGIDQDVFRKSVKKFMERLSLLIKQKGGHIE